MQNFAEWGVLEECKKKWIKSNVSDKAQLSLGCVILSIRLPSRKHAYIILTPLNPTFIQ